MNVRIGRRVGSRPPSAHPQWYSLLSSRRKRYAHPVENFTWWLLAVAGGWFGGCIAGVIGHWTWQAYQRRKDDLGVRPEDLADTVLSLQRSLRMLQGRVNTISPPRLGTGDHTDGAEIVDPGASQRPLLRAHSTRAGVLARWREIEALRKGGVR